MTKHHVKKCKLPKCDCIPPWSETRVEPDTQWCPIVPIRSPLKTVKVPFYTSSEDPAPEWAANIIIKPACSCHVRHGKHSHKCGRNVWGGCEFLRSHWHDDILRHVYGRNPFSDTVNSGGCHFQ